MRSLPLGARGALVLAAAWLLLPASVWAQDKAKTAVDPTAMPFHTMEIYNGTTRTVHYFSSSTSPSEVAALRELEQAENDAGLQARVQTLMRQYLINESRMEDRRHAQQMSLYGYAWQNAASSYGVGGYAGGGYYGALYGYAGMGGYPSLAAGSTGSSGSSYSLANGIGDEGVIKRDLAAALAAQASPEARTHVARNLMRAQAYASSFPQFRDRIGAIAAPSPEGDVLVLKDGSRVEGQILKEDADWVTIRTGAKDKPREERVRMSEVMRMSKGGSGTGVKEAANP